MPHSASFPAEFVDSYEIGAHTTWLDGNLLLNAALFHQRYEDFQLNSFLGTSFVVRSIPEASRAASMPKCCSSTAASRCRAGGDVHRHQVRRRSAAETELRRLPRATASFAPRWSLTMSTGYEWDFARDLVARMKVGAKLPDAYTVANARIGIGRRDRRWMVERWGRTSRMPSTCRWHSMRRCRRARTTPSSARRARTG